MTQHNEETRQKIVNIAKDLFSEKGFEKTSMAAIAESVGISEKSLCSVFTTKEDIFAAFMESSASHEIAEAFLNLSPTKPIQEALLEFSVFYLKSFLTSEILTIYRLALQEGTQSAIGSIFYRNGPQKGWLIICDFLTKKIEENIIRPCNVWTAAMQFKGLLEAGLLEPLLFKTQQQPSAEAIEAQATMAVSSFLTLYDPYERDI